MDEIIDQKMEEAVKKEMDSLASVIVKESPFESSEVGKLFEALAKAQLEMEVAKNESTNPYFKSKYADLASVVKASRPFLAKNGLSVIQRILPNGEGKLYLFTRLCHSSGQWMESKMPLTPPKPDIQSIGSYITYLRRYNYATVVGVVSADEDDDGEIAMETSRKNSSSSSNISKAQLQVLSQELEGYDDILEAILKKYNLGKLSDLPASSYTGCINRLREIKRAKEK